MRPIAPISIKALTLTSALGQGHEALLSAVQLDESGLRPQAEAHALQTWVGRVQGLDERPLPAPWQAWDCRATRLAWLALQADGFADALQGCLKRFGAVRVGMVLGTSASTLGASEQAYRHLASDGGFPAALRLPALHSPHAVTDFVAQVLGLQGPAVTVSTACSSSARALGQAERWLRLGLVDAVVVGGLDALCDSILYGFNALGLVSSAPCQPFDAARRGISVGEAAGFALLQRAVPSGSEDDQALLLGWGESNDAHHMSSPHPQGRGAEQALDAALARAGMTTAQAIDYLSLHGTGTPQNDAVESALVARRYSPQVHASATKGMTGHAMGAAGIVGLAFGVLAVRSGWCSGSPQIHQPDPALGPVFASQLKLRAHQRPVRTAALHAFGFGGNNCVVLLGQAGGRF